MVTQLEIEIITKLVLAAFLGGAVGFEREIHHHPAGIRTYALVCLGATLFTLMSATITGNAADPTRMAAGVVTGIGFLAAGIIFKSESNVHGLTTAAAVWCMAAVGVAIGVGMYYAAIVATVIIITILGPVMIVESDKIHINDDYGKKRKKRNK